MSLSDRLSVHKGVVEHLVNSFSTAEQSQAYVEAIDRLVIWLDNSLDIYRVRHRRSLGAHTAFSRFVSWEYESSPDKMHFNVLMAWLYRLPVRC